MRTLSAPMSYVLYMSIHDPEYPRNNRIRAFLHSALNLESVLIGEETRGSYLSRCLRLGQNAWTNSKGARAVILSEFALQYFWVAWFVARIRRTPLVVDFFVGLYETNVEDWRRFAPASPRAHIHRAFDLMALRSADLVVTDTAVRALHLQQKAKAQVLTLPVGAPKWAHANSPRKESDEFRLLYYGNYVPLHGIDTIVKAIDILTSSTTRPVRVTMIGAGERRWMYERIAMNSRAASSYRFLDPVAEQCLTKYIHDHDAILGIFGDSQKAATVIANKVWQGLACGRTVVTRRSDALNEIADIAGDFLVQVPPTNPQALAEALRGLDVADNHSIDGTVNVTEALETYVESKYRRFGCVLTALMDGAPGPSATTAT